MSALLDLVAADTGAPLRRVSVGKNGPEYAGRCPFCGGRDRFHVWPEEAGGKVPGRWWCRGCGKHGDALSYLTEFRGMTFPEACALLGIDGSRLPRVPRTRREQPPTPDPLAPRECTPPSELWQTKANELVVWAEAQLWAVAGTRARAYLASRGLTEETMRRNRLGWIPAKRFLERPEWGLNQELREDGKPRKLFVQPGVLIPCRDDAGRVVSLRVRYWTAEHGSTPPDEPGQDKPPSKYRNVTGSDMRALITGIGPTAVVIESDLDALLLAQDAGDLVKAVALGSADVRPDPVAAELLKAAPLILVALDTDPAGGKAARRRWSKVKNAVLWPIPAKYGKDPGEARGNGLRLRAWILAGLSFAGVAAPRTVPGAAVVSDETKPLPLVSPASAPAVETPEGSCKGQMSDFAHRNEAGASDSERPQAVDTPTRTNSRTRRKQVAKAEEEDSLEDLLGLSPGNTVMTHATELCRSCEHRRYYEMFCHRHYLSRQRHPGPVGPCPRGLGKMNRKEMSNGLQS